MIVCLVSLNPHLTQANIVSLPYTLSNKWRLNSAFMVLWFFMILCFYLAPLRAFWVHWKIVGIVSSINTSEKYIIPARIITVCCWRSLGALCVVYVKQSSSDRIFPSVNSVAFIHWNCILFAYAAGITNYTTGQSAADLNNTTLVTAFALQTLLTWNNLHKDLTDFSLFHRLFNNEWQNIFIQNVQNNQYIVSGRCGIPEFCRVIIEVI